jgi:hypothetical protein
VSWIVFFLSVNILDGVGSRGCEIEKQENEEPPRATGIFEMCISNRMEVEQWKDSAAKYSMKSL